MARGPSHPSDQEPYASYACPPPMCALWAVPYASHPSDQELGLEMAVGTDMDEDGEASADTHLTPI